MFERNAILWLRQWREKKTRKPLVIRGARQVGKTSLVDAFAREFDCYLHFNLDVADDLALFEKEQSVQELYSTLLIVRGKRKDAGSTLLFIDEIQNSPVAIKMLRYFYEQLPDVYVISAGSLLETMLHRNRDVSFPVGRVEYMELRPCTFDEFLGALGETNLRQLVRDIQVLEVLHSRVERLFDLYTLIGGMPQVVAEYATSRDIVALDDVYQSLLAGYQDDVEKYTTSEISRNVIRHSTSLPMAGRTRTNRLLLTTLPHPTIKAVRWVRHFALWRRLCCWNCVIPQCRLISLLSLTIRNVHGCCGSIRDL